jgi:opacity protein-like surface antigen
MRKIVLLAAAVATLSSAAILPASAQITPQGWNSGCYRFGETGYHWYGFCLGPNFAYPHKRVCDHGNCSYTW